MGSMHSFQRVSLRTFSTAIGYWYFFLHCIARLSFLLLPTQLFFRFLGAAWRRRQRRRGPHPKGREERLGLWGLTSRHPGDRGHSQSSTPEPPKNSEDFKTQGLSAVASKYPLMKLSRPDREPHSAFSLVQTLKEIDSAVLPSAKPKVVRPGRPVLEESMVWGQ